MCPACIAGAALIAAGVMSTGGLTAFVVTKFRPSNFTNEMGSLDSTNHNDPKIKSDTKGKEQI
jgi:hypothetical protein